MKIISSTSMPMKVNPVKSSIAASKWLFIAEKRKRISQAKSSLLSRTPLRPFTKTFETEQIFMNTAIAFTKQEKAVIDFAQDVNVHQLDIHLGGESRIDIAKSVHTKSIADLNKTWEAIEREASKTKEVAVLDDEDLMSARSQGISELQSVATEVAENKPHFVTETNSDQYISELQKIDRKQMKAIIKASLPKPESKFSAIKINGTIYSGFMNDLVKVKPSAGSLKFRTAVLSLAAKEENSVKPILGNLPDPTASRNFCARQFRKQYSAFD